MRSVMFLVMRALAVAILIAPPVFAREIETECPRISPVDNRTPLAFVSILHDGEDEWGYPDFDVERRDNGRIYGMNDFEASGFTKARMECIFAVNRRPPLHSTFLPMPGLLLRCESEGPDSSDFSAMYGRVWCTSRIE
jgi:hypothetical protein